jgi:hypothetical protein
MKLGLLGPAADSASLKAAALGLRQKAGAERIVYLGTDQKLEEIVLEWARALVGEEASEDGLLARATKRCLSASPYQIDQFIRKERELAHLRMYESLPNGRARSVDILGGKVAVLIHDKALLEEDDILPAALLIFGKNPEPLIKQIGRRWFLSPGLGGIMTVSDVDDELTATVFGADFSVLQSEVLSSDSALKMRVQGSA